MYKLCTKKWLELVHNLLCYTDHFLIHVHMYVGGVGGGERIICFNGRQICIVSHEIKIYFNSLCKTGGSNYEIQVKMVSTYTVG